MTRPCLRLLAIAAQGCALAALLNGTLATAAEATRTNGPSANRQDYDHFRIISERNIFNTRRYARNTPAPQPRETQRRYVRVETVALVGTIGYDKGPYAFFEGSSSSLSKVAKLNDEVAGYRVTQIYPNRVKLESGTNAVELKIGYQLRREDQGAWQITEREQPRAVAATTSTDSRRSSYTSTPTVSPTAPVQTGTDPNAQMLPPAQVLVIDPNSGEPTIVAPLEGSPGGLLPSGVAPGEALTNGLAAPAPAPGAENDVLRRLMERRAQELNR